MIVKLLLSLLGLGVFGLFLTRRWHAYRPWSDSSTSSIEILDELAGQNSPGKVESQDELEVQQTRVEDQGEFDRETTHREFGIDYGRHRKKKSEFD